MITGDNYQYQLLTITSHPGVEAYNQLPVHVSSSVNGTTIFRPSLTVFLGNASNTPIFPPALITKQFLATVLNLRFDLFFSSHTSFYPFLNEKPRSQSSFKSIFISKELAGMSPIEGIPPAHIHSQRPELSSILTSIKVPWIINVQPSSISLPAIIFPGLITCDFRSSVPNGQVI